MSLINTYFDFSDFSDPVSFYVDTSFYWAILPGFEKKTNIFIKKNQATLNDDIIQMFSDKNIDFFQIQNYDESLEYENTTEGTMVSFFFRLDSNYDSYQRQVYSFWDFLGQVGGLNESLVIIGSVLTVLFTERLFYASVISRMYQVRLKISKHRWIPLSSKQIKSPFHIEKL